MHPLIALLLLAAPVPRDWKTFSLGMSQAQFNKALAAHLTASGVIPTGHYCTELTPAQTPTSEGELLPRVTVTPAQGAAPLALHLRFFTPYHPLVVCAAEDNGYARITALLDNDAVVLLQVQIGHRHDLSGEDIAFLSQSKYGAPTLANLLIAWREPTESGWKAHTQQSSATVWRDEETLVILSDAGGVIGAARLQLFDLAAMKKIAEVADDKRPDPVAAHHTDLLRAHKF